jgi:hypothetical protein
MNEIAKLVPTKSDVELAAEHRENIIKASEPLMAALSAARTDGFIAQLNFGEDAFKKIVINAFQLLKPF